MAGIQIAIVILSSIILVVVTYFAFLARRITDSVEKQTNALSAQTEAIKNQGESVRQQLEILSREYLLKLRPYVNMEYSNMKLHFEKPHSSQEDNSIIGWLRITANIKNIGILPAKYRASLIKFQGEFANADDKEFVIFPGQSLNYDLNPIPLKSKERKGKGDIRIEYHSLHAKPEKLYYYHLRFELSDAMGKDKTQMKIIGEDAG